MSSKDDYPIGYEKEFALYVVRDRDGRKMGTAATPALARLISLNLSRRGRS